MIIEDCLDSRQVSDLELKSNRRLTFASSAPGEPPASLPRPAQGTGSELERNVRRAQTMVSDIHRTIVQGQGENSSNKPPVSDSRILVVMEDH